MSDEPEYPSQGDEPETPAEPDPDAEPLTHTEDEGETGDD